ncbi:unnamed protein product [marine sediment metagenome]|uniref:Uncharacterized protein n=1 Tax=marine sediment metagenome TaxID=412755 RepID=X0VXQ7_9ZZZZ
MPEEITPEETELEIEIEAEEIRRSTALISPEALIMFPIAILLDLFGVVCFILYFAFGIGVPLSFVPDLIGMFIFGIWIFFRSQSLKIVQPRMKAAKKAKIRIAKIAKSAKWAKRLKWLRPLFILFEFIPVAGDVLFLWTLLVYFELKS